MPLRNVSDLYEAVESWILAPDLKSEIPDFVRLSEIFTSRELGWRFTNVEATGTLSSGSSTITPPSDCLWVEWVRFDTDPGPTDMTVASAREFTRIKRTLTEGESPSVCRHVGTNLMVAPAAADDIPYTIWYHRLMTPLDDANPTNWLITNGFDCLLWAACMEGCSFRGDEAGELKFEKKFARAFGSLKKLEWRARTGAGNLMVRSDYQRAPSPRRV